MHAISTVRRAQRAALLGATMLAGLVAPVHAQSATQDAAPVASPPAAAASPAEDAGEVIVTGYRRSLAQSTTAKRDATGFTDSIFAEDIGKFPRREHRGIVQSHSGHHDQPRY